MCACVCVDTHILHTCTFLQCIMFLQASLKRACVTESSLNFKLAYSCCCLSWAAANHDCRKALRHFAPDGWKILTEMSCRSFINSSGIHYIHLFKDQTRLHVLDVLVICFFNGCNLLCVLSYIYLHIHAYVGSG